MNNPNQNEKTFKLHTYKTVQVLNDELRIRRYGFTKRLALSEINEVFLLTGTSESQFFITYDSNRKIIRLSVTDAEDNPKYEENAKKLVVELAGRIPPQPSCLSDDEKCRLGRRSFLKGMAYSLFLVVFVVMAPSVVVFGADFLPDLKHAFQDTELTDIRLDELYYKADPPASNYIKVSGRLSNEFVLVDSYTNERDTNPSTLDLEYLYYKEYGQLYNKQLSGADPNFKGQKSFSEAYVALLPPSWKTGDEIRVLIKVSEKDIEALKAQVGTDITVTGMLDASKLDARKTRNTSSWKYISEHAGSPVNNPWQIVMNATPGDYRKTLYAYGAGVVGVPIVTLLILVLVLMLKGFTVYNPNKRD